jgi:hypothetical protein
MDDEIKESYESCVQKLLIFCAKFGMQWNTMSVPMQIVI